MVRTSWVQVSAGMPVTVVDISEHGQLILPHYFIFFRLYFLSIYIYMVLFPFNNVIYVFLLRPYILIICLYMATLTEVFFPAFSSVERQMPG